MKKQIKVIPSLSDRGWIYSSKEMLEYLISYYILSDSAQSISFQGKIINLSETYYKYINSPEEFSSGIKQDLNDLLSKYFINVNVNTKIKEISKSKYAILLNVSVMDEENNKYELTSVTDTATNELRKVVTLNNYGQADALFNSM